MTPSSRLRLSLPLAFALLLAACGGGGGGSETGSGTSTGSGTNPGTGGGTAGVLTVQAPYVRLVMVDPSHAQASDSGPGTAQQPYRSIAPAMQNLRPGDDVVIAAGTYREMIVVPALSWGTAQTRVRALNARSVLVKGSDPVTAWTAGSNGVYSVAWNGEEPQQVFRAGRLLQQVGGTVFGGYPLRPPADLAGLHASEGGIWPGRVDGSSATMPVDSFVLENGRLFVRLATPLSAGEALDVSTRRHVLKAESVSRFAVQGLDFAHSNTSVIYRQGAVIVMGDNNALTDLVVQDMDGACVQLAGNDNALSDSTIQRCGQLGVSGRGTRLAVSGNTVSQANTRGFNTWWEAGGMKFVGVGGAHQTTVRNNVVVNNKGDGIWFDWKNTDNLIEGNTTAYNTGFGIHYEASQAGTVRGNRAYGNGLRGIYLIESSRSVVEGNAVFGNALEGIVVADGTRSAQDAELRPTQNQVMNNAVAWNDINRNWVQLVLPGASFGTRSDRNAFKAVVLSPRMSLGFVSSTNPAYVSLQAWRAATSADQASTEQTLSMPAVVDEAIRAKRVLQAAELPGFLASPGSF